MTNDEIKYNDIESQLVLGSLDLAILKTLADAGTDGLPLKLLAIKVAELLFRSTFETKKRQHAILLSVYRRLAAWETKRLGLVYYREKPINKDYRIPNKMSRNPVGCYVLEAEGRRQMEVMKQLFSELNKSFLSHGG